MKFLFAILVIFPILTLAQRQKEILLNRIDFFPLGLQSRYQDNTNQVKDFTFGYSLSINYAYREYHFGLEFNQFSEESGTSALYFENKTQDYLLSTGYQLLRIDDATKEKISFLVRAQGYIGLRNSNISRTLNSIHSVESADPDLVIGLGAAATGRFFQYFIAEADFRILYAKNSNPQVIPAQTLRLGVGFGF